MNDVDKLILLAKENATMKAKMEVDDALDRMIENIRAQIKELEKDDE